MHKRAFTLIELLVVVTIIVILLALFTPVLDKAIEAGQRAVCASNQHQLQRAVMLYSYDHKQKLFQTSIIGAPYRLPALARKKEGVNQSGFDDEFNVISLGPYAGGVYPTDPDYGRRLGKVWFCPSQYPPNQEPMYSFLAHHWEGNNTPVLGFDHLFLTYSYFARVGTASGTVTRPDDLTDTKLGSKLLFSDTIYWGPYAGNQWMFNHGVEGPAFWNGQNIPAMQGA